MKLLIVFTFYVLLVVTVAWLLDYSHSNRKFDVVGPCGQGVYTLTTGTYFIDGAASKNIKVCRVGE